PFGAEYVRERRADGGEAAAEIFVERLVVELRGGVEDAVVGPAVVGEELAQFVDHRRRSWLACRCCCTVHCRLILLRGETRCVRRASRRASRSWCRVRGRDPRLRPRAGCVEARSRARRACHQQCSHPPAVWPSASLGWL